MSDLEKILEIVKESYASNMKKIENEFLDFMKKTANESVKKLDSWLVGEHKETYDIKFLPTIHSFSDLIVAGENLGFNVRKIDNNYFQVYIPKSGDSTVAQQLLKDFIVSLEQEKTRLDKLAEENFNILLENINAKNFTVTKFDSCWHVELEKISFPHPLIATVAQRFCKLMNEKGFTGTCVTRDSCNFNINEVTHSRKCKIF